MVLLHINRLQEVFDNGRLSTSTGAEEKNVCTLLGKQIEEVGKLDVLLALDEDGAARLLRIIEPILGQPVPMFPRSGFKVNEIVKDCPIDGNINSENSQVVVNGHLATSDSVMVPNDAPT